MRCKKAERERLSIYTRDDGRKMTERERESQRELKKERVCITRGDVRRKKSRERVCVYSIPGVMEAPAAIYILSAISTSDMFSTSSVKACTSSNDIPSCTMMVEICTHTIEYANLYQYVNVLKQHCE